jgi:L-seryl-tRNA(Ser) seleniumtransferase
MQELLRQLPKIDKLLEDERLKHIPAKLGSKIAAKVVEDVRKDILASKIQTIEYEKIIEATLCEYGVLKEGSLRPLINATGITIHTNLGRSVLDKKSLQNAFAIASSYSNLEYDLQKGKRGDRYDHLNKLCSYLFEGYELLLVNNNAAAVFLVLNTFAKAKNTVVSRSELVEIGGGFRVPQVMANSGTNLVEVGTTNKSRISDYEEVIDQDCAMLMKVHKSNFSIEGFFEEADIEQIASLAKQKEVYSYYDLGSAMIEPLSVNKDEAVVSKLCKSGIDIISFSSDKLMGSTQGGIILAKKELIEKLKKNQLLRMLRADKVTIALLQEALKHYLFQSHREIPTYKMLSCELGLLKENAKMLCKALQEFCPAKVIKTKTYSGGGSMPNISFDSYGVAIECQPKKLESYLRKNAVIARIEDEKLLLDVRTILNKQFEQIIHILRSYYETN